MPQLSPASGMLIMVVVLFSLFSLMVSLNQPTLPLESTDEKKSSSNRYIFF
uniref:ATP synthase subunit 8 n=1 Tax=Salinator rhamphidia TaxID=981055 RepID=G8HR52_9GAST|nr:ATP synthase F0 subunit 8 [Salinator rhamphidia]AEQ93900.1 ATP synthase subunit 8 [Salinator rhamphidia]